MGCHSNWQNAALAKATGLPFKISRHNDSCGDGGAGCTCQPDAGSFDFYDNVRGVPTLCAWLKEQPWREDFYLQLVVATGVRFGGDDIPAAILTPHDAFVTRVLNYVRAHGLAP